MFVEIVNQLCHGLAVFGEKFLMPIMLTTFVVGLTIRFLIFYTIRGEFGFAKEFEARVHRYLDREYEDIAPGQDFHGLTETILRKTFHEVYKMRATYLRRKLDRAVSFFDRLFLIEEGAKRLIHDTIKQTKYYKDHRTQPAFDDVAKFVFLSNPYFNRVIGLFPIGLFNDVLNILPGLFIIAGVFNTFLGIMLGLPDLQAMDIANLAGAKGTLDAFLMKMALAMNTSILGIAFAVILTLVNTILSPSDMVVTMTDKFKLSLEFLWNDTGKSAGSRPVHAVTSAGEAPGTDFPRPLSLANEPEVVSRRGTFVADREPSIEFSMAARLLKDRIAKKSRRGGDDSDESAA